MEIFETFYKLIRKRLFISFCDKTLLRKKSTPRVLREAIMRTFLNRRLSGEAKSPTLTCAILAAFILSINCKPP